MEIEEVPEIEEVVGAVAVAVNKHSKSVSALMLALSNKLVPENGSIKLLHVYPVVRTIPTPMGNVPVEKVRLDKVAAHRQALQLKIEQHLKIHKRWCDHFKVKAEILLIESDSISHALLEQCSKLNITKLILGTSNRNRLIRKLRMQNVAEIIAKHAPDFCSVLVVAKEKLIFLREATCIPPVVHNDLLNRHAGSGALPVFSHTLNGLVAVEASHAALETLHSSQLHDGSHGGLAVAGSLLKEDEVPISSPLQHDSTLQLASSPSLEAVHNASSMADSPVTKPIPMHSTNGSSMLSSTLPFAFGAATHSSIAAPSPMAPLMALPPPTLHHVAAPSPQAFLSSLAATTPSQYSHTFTLPSQLLQDRSAPASGDGILQRPRSGTVIGYSNAAVTDPSSNFGRSAENTSPGTSPSSLGDFSLDQGEILGFVSEPLPIRREQVVSAVNNEDGLSTSGPARSPFGLFGNEGRIHALTLIDANLESSRIYMRPENESGHSDAIEDGTSFGVSAAFGNCLLEDWEMTVARQMNELSQTFDQSTEVEHLQPILKSQSGVKILTFSDTNSSKVTGRSEVEMLKAQLEEAWKRVRDIEEAAALSQHKDAESNSMTKREPLLQQENLLAEQLAKIALKDKARVHNEAFTAAESSKQKLESKYRQKREAEEEIHEGARQEAMVSLLQSEVRYRPYYRQYSLEELSASTSGFSQDCRLGEGGYGTVYRGQIHHTPVAIKVLKEGSVQGLNEFQWEVELLGRINHPHMVLLLGACPEQGCLVYEYLENGSLEDRLFCRHNSPPIPWYIRLRITAEIGIALHFLHSLRPDPLVHRDLKPANIMLDRNFISKIGDVGLARLVPDAISYSITEYRDTVPVGTFAYIDPEYQRTGVFCPKSDVYAFGIVMLQLLTGSSPVGVIEKVENALGNGSIKEILDPCAGDWPLDKAEEVALIALQCAEFRRRDRPDLKADVLPILERVKAAADKYAVWIESNNSSMTKCSEVTPSIFLCPIYQEIMEDPHIAADGFTYEYEAIKLWLENHNTSPMTNLKLSHKHLTPNHSLRSAVLEWKERAATFQDVSL